MKIVLLLFFFFSFCFYVGVAQKLLRIEIKPIHRFTDKAFQLKTYEGKKQNKYGKWYDKYAYFRRIKKASIPQAKKELDSISQLVLEKNKNIDLDSIALIKIYKSEIKKFLELFKYPDYGFHFLQIKDTIIKLNRFDQKIQKDKLYYIETFKPIEYYYLDVGFEIEVSLSEKCLPRSKKSKLVKFLN